MENIIRVLPDAVANQIAAGEVIQRPASVVKELMENAIDAGASRIEVRLKDAGKTTIQVIDDGKGMSPADARIAFERHSTSKLKSAADLFNLKTMGFRGEALASIAAVAYVELVTKRPIDELSWKVEIEGSEITNEEPTFSAQGSKFTVRNLFYNIPARRKFLSDNNKEFKNIRDEFIQIALVNTGLELLLYHNEELIYQLTPSSVKQRILSVFGKRSSGQLTKMLYPVDVNTDLIKISGFVGDPGAACLRDPLQYFFVNGRFIKHKFFRSAVLKAYETLLPSGMQPAFFLYFESDPHSLDINIHPTKTEVKFEYEQAIWPIVHASVREALGKFNAVPSIDFDRDDAPDIRVFTGDKAVDAPKVSYDASYNPFKATTKSNVKDWDSLFTSFNSGDSINNETADNSPDGFISEDRDLNPDNPKFQLYRKYIVLKSEYSLMFVHQQRAHIRVLYDKFKKQLQYRKSLSQSLLFPAVVQLDKEQEIAFSIISEDLSALGFKFNFLSGGEVEVLSVPVDLQGKDSMPVLLEMIDSINNSGADNKSLLTDKIALKMAKSLAVREGQLLSSDEMDALISDLSECQDKRYTPDGNIISYLLTDLELNNRF